MCTLKTSQTYIVPDIHHTETSFLMYTAHTCIIPDTPACTEHRLALFLMHMTQTYTVPDEHDTETYAVPDSHDRDTDTVSDVHNTETYTVPDVYGTQTYTVPGVHGTQT